MRSWNVLVFPGGSEIGLEIQSSLNDCKEVRLFSAGSDVSNHAPFVFAHHYILPSIHEPNWIESLNQLITRLAIDFIIPAYDDVVVALASNQKKIKARVVTSPLETCLIARRKSQTYGVLGGVVPVPAIYNAAEITCFPVFAKPDCGQGSQGARVIANKHELALLQPGEIVVEYLPGEEYTIDCFSDRKKGLMFVGGRERLRTRNGISVSTIARSLPEFRKYAEAIGAALQFHGAWFFQLKRDTQGILKLLEVAPRIAGAMAFHRALGLNFPLLSLYEQDRIPFDILMNEGIALHLDRAFTNRYSHDIDYSSVYVDLDDTLITNGLVNIKLITFLYQCLNAGIRLILLTKHAHDPAEVLRHHRLLQLFDQIIHLAPDGDKADAITEFPSIFIDDSFAERRSVQGKTGIPTFDLSMIEMLFDHRAW